MYKKDFYAEVSERKALSNAARHVKRGSKSKKCTLPSDYLTPAQFKRRSGDVMSYKLTEPMSWDDFRHMPHDIQKEYITGIQSKFIVTQAMLGEMFGISNTHLSKHLKAIGFEYSVKQWPSKSDKELFYNWCCGTEPSANQDTIIVTQENQDTPVALPEVNTAYGMQLADFELTFTGKPDIAAIANSLRALIADINTEATIAIYYSRPIANT